MSNPVSEPTQAAARSPAERSGAAWALWAAASSTPWLLPTHAAPWPSFYSELLMAVLLLPVAAWVVCIARGRWSVDWLAVGFALAASVPALQAFGGMFSFPGEATLVSLYLIGFALMLLVARRAEEVAPSRLVDALFAGLAIAALCSTGLAIYQWLGLDSLGLMVLEPVIGGRPGANVGQPNNLSTLLVWGLVAIWWAHSRRQVGGAVVAVAAAFLLLGVMLTQSRTGWLAVGMLGIAAFVGRRVLRTSNQAPTWVALALWFLALILAFEPLSHFLLHEPALSLGDQLVAGKRPAIWKMALEASTQRPWLGYGWNQSIQAHVAMAAEFPLRTTVQNAHNLVLDLMLWNGLPLATLMVGGFGFWSYRVLRGGLTTERALLLLALSVLLLHAMLELPHMYAFFLLPAAVMMGTLGALAPSPAAVKIPRVAVGLLVLLIAGVLILMFDEYRRIEASGLNALKRAARIAKVAPNVEPDVKVLRSLQDALLALRTEPRRGMSAEELDSLRRAFTRYPGDAGLLKYALSAALNGRANEARWALGILCRLNSIAKCQAAARSWSEVGASGNPEVASIAFPFQESFPLTAPAP